MKKWTAIDVFAGGGGLSVGLKRAGFEVSAAIEIESAALATYKANHPEVATLKQDVSTLSGDFLAALSPTGCVDLLAGCPPCQGFCSLTSKSKKSDPRNKLVLEMGRLVTEIKPVALMMENVPGLAIKGGDLFQRLLALLVEQKYEINWGILQVADFGIPQRRRRLVLVAGKGFKIPLPEPTHARVPSETLKSWRVIDDILKNMPSPITLKEAKAIGGASAVNWHVVRTLSPENMRRIKNAKQGRHWSSIPKRLRPECHKDRNAGFSNVYGRMSWGQPSVTITGGCTTLSKGRFGHPEENRTISVREAALLQTFPEDYIFDSPFMDKVCDIVGNALPCDFAEIVARSCMTALKKHQCKP